MSEAKIVRVRNVNQALWRLVDMRPEEDTMNWRRVSPRGMETVEYKGLFITEYTNPMERVLFSAARDANPFFHFFESLWILGGRKDVEFLAQFNPKMREFSDDGLTYHAPYGHRLRHHFNVDQLLGVIQKLRHDPDSRQAVMSIWDPVADLTVQSKDIPCNDMVFFKVRDGHLDMTVACRSNDAIWGAYGANAVQFSMIQEFVAGALGVGVGAYRQSSDSFHIYVGNEAWERSKNACTVEVLHDPYTTKGLDVRIEPYSIWNGVTYDAEQGWRSHRTWLAQLAIFFDYADAPMSYVNSVINYPTGFFHNVVMPMWTAWNQFKKLNVSKNGRISAAQATLHQQCVAPDWKHACIEWLERRVEK